MLNFVSGDKNTEVCSMGDIRCYINAEDKFSKELIVQQCNCLPDCFSISYDVEISQAKTYGSETDDALKNALNESRFGKNH